MGEGIQKSLALLNLSCHVVIYTLHAYIFMFTTIYTIIIIFFVRKSLGELGLENLLRSRHTFRLYNHL